MFSLGALVVALPAGLISAIVLNDLHRFKRTVRSLFLLPWLMSQAIAGTIWLWFLNPNYGPASYITTSLGWGPTDAFSSPTTALIAVTLITAWWSYPQAMLLFLGARCRRFRRSFAKASAWMGAAFGGVSSASRCRTCETRSSPSS